MMHIIYSNKEKLFEDDEWECYGSRYAAGFTRHETVNNIVCSYYKVLASFHNDGYVLENDKEHELKCWNLR